MLKYILITIALLGFLSCSSGVKEEYLSFQSHNLLSGNISITPRFNRNTDREKMDGDIYINISRAFLTTSSCKIQAEIVSPNMDLERSRVVCDTDNKTCFFNTGDFQNNPRMFLSVTDAPVVDISLIVSLTSKFDGDEKKCAINQHELILEPKLKKPKFWEKALAR